MKLRSQATLPANSLAPLPLVVESLHSKQRLPHTHREVMIVDVTDLGAQCSKVQQRLRVQALEEDKLLANVFIGRQGETLDVQDADILRPPVRVMDRCIVIGLTVMQSLLQRMQLHKSVRM